MKRFGMCFSRDFTGATPLSHIGSKLPVYLRLLELCQSQGWEVYVLTRKTYKSGKIFEGAWLFKNLPAGRQGGKFERIEKPVAIDLVFDWVGNLMFPPKNEKELKVVNIHEFKILTCDKWLMYQKLAKYMPKTLWVGKLQNAQSLIPQIGTENIVLKPIDGLRGKGIYIGTKDGLKNFTPDKPGRKYILQEFVDTQSGIAGLTLGKHDLRIVVVNNKVVWCHIRIPPNGTFLANAAQGGTLTEVDYSLVPQAVKKIVSEISADFYKDFDNPMFSLDFGINEKGTPLIFEINDQIGFPRDYMKSKETFLKELVANFASKI